MHKDEDKNLKEITLSGSYSDVRDVNSDHALAIIEPQTLERLEGLEDDDIFAPKQKSKIDLTIGATLKTIVKDITPRKIKKGVAKEKKGRGKKLKTKEVIRMMN